MKAYIAASQRDWNVHDVLNVEGMHSRAYRISGTSRFQQTEEYGAASSENF